MLTQDSMWSFCLAKAAGFLEIKAHLDPLRSTTSAEAVLVRLRFNPLETST